MANEQAGVRIGDYHYKTLATSSSGGEPKEFRLLTILPGAGDDVIQCYIDHHALPRSNDPDLIPYEALSWTWGDEDDPERIIVLSRDISDKKRVLPVKPNLYQALKHLRLPVKERVLWVDYVCIDQRNKSEKDLQVKFIFHIYRRASNVCIWLGDHEHQSEKAITFIRDKVSDLGLYEQITSDANLKEEWKALAALMDRKWFRRRWVVQELALARRATVHCGDKSMDWNEFEIAVSLFERDAGKLAGFYEAHKPSAFDREIFGHVSQMGATRLVQLRSNLFRFDDDGEITDWRFNLGDLVSNLWSYEAKEPHDMIYAILSLARDTQSRVNVPPSQGSPVSDTFPADTSPQVPRPRAAGRSRRGTSRGSRQSTPARNTRGSRRSQSDFSPTASSSSPMGEQHRVHYSPEHEPEPKRQRTTSDGAQGRLSRDTTAAGPSRQTTAGSETEADTMPPEREPVTEREQARWSRLAGTAIDQFRRTIQPENRTSFNVDYAQKFFLVCKQFLNFTIPKTDYHNLDILLRPWAPEIVNEDPLPSWIPSVTKAAFERTRARHAPGGYKTTRTNADPLVGQYTHGTRSSNYNACKNPKAHQDEWKLDPMNYTDKKLSLSGFVLDSIDEIKDASQFGSITPEWLTLGGLNRTSRASDQVVDGLWRTLVADRGPDGSNTKGYYRTAFCEAVEDSPGRGIHTTELTHRGHTILVEFLKRVEAVVTNRRIFKSHRGQHLGLAPNEAKDGDQICIIRGMSVPVVLRPIGHGKGKYYNMIGECYLHTMMDGRAIDVQEKHLERLDKEGRRESEEFALWSSQWFELR